MNYKDKANKAELIKYKDKNLKKLDAILSLGINSSDDNEYKRAALISYWLDDFNKYLSWEKTFDPKHLKKYERGDIIKVNLGFNVGDEQGGMHYAVVLENNNALSNAVVTVIPLSSKKATKPVHPNDVDLGNDIYTKLKIKLTEKKKSLKSNLKELVELNALLIKSSDIPEDSPEVQVHIASLSKKIDEAKKQLTNISKIEKEIAQMKVGSIAVISQITTVSKLRIFDPRSSEGVLSNVKLSPENLDLINEKMKELFLR